MIDNLFHFLKLVDEFFWGYIAFVVIMVLGLYFTLRSRFFQLFQLPRIIKTFFSCFKREKNSEKKGVHPLFAFFASTGGMIGIGNVVGVATSVQLGGPGALLWIWIAGLIGAIMKYSEIYLGIKFRQPNKQGGYDGGPTHFLKKAFRWKWIPTLVAVLLCLYGVEVYQFSVISNSIVTNWHLNAYLVIGTLLGLVVWAAVGGVRRIGQICSWIVPFFLLLYVGMGLFVVLHEGAHLPSMLALVLKSAFTGHAAVGGFAGASIILAVQQGVARAAYSSDIGIGYDSIIQSESRVTRPEKQAELAIVGVFIDNMICTLSVLVILLSGAWTLSGEGSDIVQAAFSNYFPFMNIFLPIFYILTGYTTLISYFCVGIKCAKNLAPRYGTRAYVVFGATSLLLFSFVSQRYALTAMSLCGAMLLVINLLGMYKLRKEISFAPEKELLDLQL